MSYFTGFVCNVCGKPLVMNRTLSGGFFWMCPDEKCSYNDYQNVKYSSSATTNSETNNLARQSSGYSTAA